MKNIVIGLFALLVFRECVGEPLKLAEQCRSGSVKRAFDRQQGFPNGRPPDPKTGQPYIVDHVCALACGGLDIPANMQYQTKSASDAKDRWERTAAGCGKTCNTSNSLPHRTVFNCN